MLKRLMLGSALALFLASPSFAQNAIEIGVDNAIGIDLVQKFEVEGVTLAESRTDIGFTLPFGMWRFGFFVNVGFVRFRPVRDNKCFAFMGQVLPNFLSGEWHVWV